MPTITADRDRFRKAREQAGITTDQDLAARMEVAPSTLSRVLGGAVVPSNRFIASAITVLATRFEDLFEVQHTP